MRPDSDLGGPAAPMPPNLNGAFMDFCDQSHPRLNSKCRLAGGHPGPHHEARSGSWSDASQAPVIDGLNTFAVERRERNRIAREAAELRQENERLTELVGRLRPLAEAAIAEDIAEELHDSPDGAANPLIVAELAEHRAGRRSAVADWHLQQMADRAEGRTPLDVTG